MASPGLLASCCLGNDSVINSDYSGSAGFIEEKVTSIISLLFALVSCVGILLTVIPWVRDFTEHDLGRNYLLHGPGLRLVIVCIILSGLLANFGIIVQSTAWIGGFYPTGVDKGCSTAKQLFCFVSSIFVVYFFLCVVSWHMLYGLETWMICRRKTISRPVLHSVGWGVPVVLCALATYLLVQSTQPRLDVGLVYLIVLLPVIVVFLILLAAFYKSSSAVKRSLIHQRGVFAFTEREMLANLHVKFILISIAFIVCWIPNLLSGIVMNIEGDTSKDIVLVLVVLQSVLNPFQVLIDSLVLCGVPMLFLCCTQRHHGYQRIREEGINNRRGHLDYNDPLISFSNQQ